MPGRRLGLLLAVLLTTPLMTAVPPAVAQTVEPAALDLAPLEPFVAAGEVLDLDARLSRADGSPLAGQAVELEARRAGSSAVSLGTVQTDADGRARFRDAPPASTTYVARRPASSAGGEVVSGPAAVDVVPVRRPHAPDVVVVDAGDGMLDVRWLPPASDGGAPVTSYTVSARSVYAHGRAPTTTRVSGDTRLARLTAPTAQPAPAATTRRRPPP